MPKTIRLDSFRYLTSEGWRALIAIEMGLKNHEMVPMELAQKISRCKRTSSGFVKLIKDQLASNGLVAFESDSRKRVQGYRLTNLGYDYLALHQLFNAGHLCDLGSMIGAGKESDVYLAIAGERCGQHTMEDASSVPSVEPGTPVVVKFHRLGRTSFRKVKDKRDYHLHRNSCSWLYLDRLASQREYLMMKTLHEHGLSVPEALAHNRNAVVMSYLSDGVLLSRILPNVLHFKDSFIAKHLYKQARDMLYKIASIGLVHGDMNEFNLIVVDINRMELDPAICDAEPSAKLVLIDFPQMISRDHPSANCIFQRDSDGLVSFFSRFYEITDADLPLELDRIERTANVDVQTKAPGYKSKHDIARISRRFDQTVLLGVTARCQSSDSSIVSDSSEGEVGEAEGINDTVSATSISEDEVVSVQCAGMTTSVSVPKKRTITSGLVDGQSGLIGADEIRVRYRRERRQKEQVLFQRQVKRHSRANIKRQSRVSLKAELTLFG